MLQMQRDPELSPLIDPTRDQKVSLNPSEILRSAKSCARPSVALVHDYLTQKGGAERVVSVLMEAFSEAPLYTSLYEAKRTFPDFINKDIRPFSLNRFGTLRRHHRLAFPLLAPAFSGHSVKADVTLCSSSGWAHGVNTSGRKVVYCYAPARWLYQAERYLGEPANEIVDAEPTCWKQTLRLRGAQLALRTLGDPLRRWDQRAAASADRYLTSSRVMATAISAPLRNRGGGASAPARAHGRRRHRTDSRTRAGVLPLRVAFASIQECRDRRRSLPQSAKVSSGDRG